MVRNWSSLSQAKSPDMDPVLWSNLPEELLEQVLSCLPLKAFLNLRSTCKHFRSLISSPFFISKHFSSSSSSPSSSSSSKSSSSFLLLSHPQFLHQYSLYDINLNSWRNSSLSLSSLLPPSAVLLSASNGLFCFSLPNSNSFLICNLLARTSRIVKFPANPFVVECFTLILTSTGYKLFLLSSNSGLSAFVYDSRTQSWQQFVCNEQNFTVNYRQKGVCFNAHLYFTTPVPFSVVGFDLGTGNWERLVADLPGELIFSRLVSDGTGKLYLFGGIGSNGISRSLKLWELGEGGENWMEIGSVPDMMCRKLVSVCFHNYEHLYIFWHEGLICVCCYSWPEILYYKVCRRTWHWLPKCPSMPEKWSCDFKWLSFVPELHAFV